jgi:hypothetical protein
MNDRRMTLTRNPVALLVGVTLIAASPAVASTNGMDHSHAAFDAILTAHVSNGLVDYQALKAQPAGLDQYLDGLAASYQDDVENGRLRKVE